MKSFRPLASLALPAFTAFPAYAQSPPGAEISLTFLGTGAPRPSLKRYGPGILVETDKHRLLVDGGSGLRERVYQAGAFALLTSIDHILVTHLHYDHTIGIADLWLSGWLYGRRVPLRVQGPAGTKAMMDGLVHMYAWDLDYRDVVGVPRKGAEILAEDVLPGVVLRERRTEGDRFRGGAHADSPRHRRVSRFSRQGLWFSRRLQRAVRGLLGRYPAL
jgi:ribonuclease Z